MAKTGDGDETRSSSATTGPRRCRGSASRRSTPIRPSHWSSPTPTSGDPVACGDILEPDADRFGEAGLAVVQLLPVGDSAVQGVAVIQRTPAAARARRDPDARAHPAVDGRRGQRRLREPAAGFDGYIQGGYVRAPSDRLRVQLKSRGDHDVSPYLATARRIRRAGHRRLLRRARRARVRLGGGVHRPGVLARHHRHRRAVIRLRAGTSSSPTTTTSPTPDWHWCNSCRSAMPACRVTR